INHQLLGESTRALDPIVCGRDYDRNFGLWKDKYLIPAGTVHSPRRPRAFTNVKRLKPPKVSVVCVRASIGMRFDGTSSPTFGQYPLTIPLAAVQIQLREFKQVTATQLKPAAS